MLGAKDVGVGDTDFAQIIGGRFVPLLLCVLNNLVEALDQGGHLFHRFQFDMLSFGQ